MKNELTAALGFLLAIGAFMLIAVGGIDKLSDMHNSSPQEVESSGQFTYLEVLVIEEGFYKDYLCNIVRDEAAEKTVGCKLFRLKSSPFVLEGDSRRVVFVSREHVSRWAGN
jgi:hypothetical protein